MDIDRNGIKVLGASTDTQENAWKTVKKYKLTFPVIYGLDPVEFSRKTGAFYNPEKGFLHATGFILDRKAKVINAVYSTSNLGRLEPKSAIKLIESHIKDEK